MRLSRLIPLLLIGILSLTFYAPANAQEQRQDEAYYIVQEGDTLWQVAARFDATPVSYRRQMDSATLDKWLLAQILLSQA